MGAETPSTALATPLAALPSLLPSLPVALSQVLSSLGVGVLLGWALLPLFAALARRSRDAAPAAYHRALGVALLGPPLLVLVPVAKLGLGAFIAQHESHAAAPVALPVRVLFAWAEPILAAPSQAAFVVPFGRGLAAVGTVWLLVFVLGVAQLVVARVRLGRRLRAADPAPEGVCMQANELAGKLGIRAPAVCVSSGFPAPFATGFLSPVVGLDPHTCALGPVELVYALEHELSHIARGDTRFAFYVEFARRCFVGHPSARWLALELGWAREAAVDARVAGTSPRGYAQFLVASAERWGLSRATSTSSVFMADTALARRIEMLTSSSRQIHAAPKRLALLGASALGLGLAALAPTSCSAPPTEASAPGRAQAQLGRPAVGGEGRLALDDIQAVIVANLPAFERCYTALPAPREKTGFDMHFVIDTDGRVASGHVDSQPFVELGECGASVMRGLHFPTPVGGVVNVSYPLAFEDAPAAAGDPTAAPPSPSVELKAGATAVSGRLHPDVIRAVMREQFGRFRDCYETLPEPRPEVGAKLHFTIGTTGSIASGHADAEESPALGQCLERVLLAVHFPAPTDGEVTVGYPVFFAPN